MSNGERTQEFMNEIFDLAEQRFETKFELGIKTVRADFMSDHTLSLTFSEHPGSDEMMEHLKDIVNGLINSIPQQRWDEIHEAKRGGELQEDVRILIALVFREMDILIRFTKQIPLDIFAPSKLYKYRDEYMLILDLSELTEEAVKRLSNLADEYATDILVGAERKSFIEEHGEAILKTHAIETLREL
jgi:adapter protein MecA 1/2